MTDAPEDPRTRWRSSWLLAAFVTCAAIGVPIMTAAWTAIPFANEEDSESARHGFAPSGPGLLIVTLVFIAMAHLVGWGLLRGIASGAPGGSRRHTMLALWTAAAVSAAGLVGALALTGGQLFAPYPRPFIP
ncbi:hypothetical protein ACMT9U_07335 [Clavibacter sp. Sh2036]|uniref:hypothetical protein n=1 Tax=Clavibacter sp. Sh2036 TaxID=3397677 RepID=UPI0039E0A834